jgi:hypothetical protein
VCQVGYLQRLYQDAGSTEHKIQICMCVCVYIYTHTHSSQYGGTDQAEEIKCGTAVNAAR